MVSLQAVTRLNIANRVLYGGQVSFLRLAKDTGLDEATLRRVLRHVMTMRVFQEPQIGMVAYIVVSKVLAEPQMNDWMSTGCEEMWPAATKI
jgi:hypothetical protein